MTFAFEKLRQRTCSRNSRGAKIQRKIPLFCIFLNLRFLGKF